MRIKKLDEFEIVDVHNHVFPDKIAIRAAQGIRDYYNLPMEGDGTLDTLKKLGRSLNIKKYIICSAATRPNQVPISHDFIHYCVENDNMLIGLGTVHADFEGFEKEIEKILAYDLRGIKIHSDFQGFAIDDPRLFDSYRLIEKYKLPILFHLGDEKSDLSTALRLRRVMERFPDLIAVAAHMGGHTKKDDAEKYLLGTPVYFDNSEWQYTMTASELVDMTRQHGIERVMFGSDYPLNSPLTCAQRLFDTGFTDEELEMIFSKNACKLFRI